MDAELRPGSAAVLEDGAQARVLREIGSGEQAWIYEVDIDGRPCALKWFRTSRLPEDRRAFRKVIADNIATGSPGPAFLWPQALTRIHAGSFGYVMPLAPERFCSFARILSRERTFASYREATRLCIELACSFAALHGAGANFAYRDLNDGNVLVDPATGELLICDCDNISPAGTPLTVSNVLGTLEYMAPEVVRGLDRFERTGDPACTVVPDYLSDRHSMAAFIYTVLTLNHPLEGAHAVTPAMDRTRQVRLYGTHPLFVMDEDDRGNRPVPGVHTGTIEVWPQLPRHLRRLFLAAFSKEALQDPSLRPGESEWIDSLELFYSQIVPCRCGNESFVQKDGPLACPSCGATLGSGLALSLEGAGARLPAVPGTTVFRGQVRPFSLAKASAPVARVVRHRGTGRLGLRNVGSEPWSYVSGTATRAVRPGSVAPLEAGSTYRICDQRICAH